MNDRGSSSTMLPPVRRNKRRDWGRIVARILCVIFALAGLIPVGLGLLVRTKWAQNIATTETRKVIAGLGIDAHYELDLSLWPLSVTLRNVRVEATDGGTPFLTARRASARPKIFGLLAGKLVIDQIEIEQPTARVVMKDGQLQNLGLKLPASDKKAGPLKAPFSVVSASEADVDVDIDGIHVVGHEIDADVTTDDDGEGGTAFEVALRVAQARARRVRTVRLADETHSADYSVDEDVLCRIDARARIEPKRILIRRFSTFGAADLDPSEETSAACDISKDDKRYVEVTLGHLSVVLPKTPGELPNVDGHVRVRAPLGLIDRIPGTPDVDGWVMVDAELRYTPETPIPDVAGRLEAGGVRVGRYHFARSLQSDFSVRRSVVTSPLTRLELADGVVEVRDIEVQPLAKGIPLKAATVDITGASFAALMQDLGVTQHPHVTWDLREIKVTQFKGTIDPLKLDGDLLGKTANFAVFDAAIDDPNRLRATGVKEGNFAGRVAVRPNALEFQHVRVNTTHSQVDDLFVSIGFHEILRVDIPHAKIDIQDLSPLGHVKMGGVAEIAKLSVNGKFNDPVLEGDILNIQTFSIGDFPFGNVTQGHVELHKLTVDLRDVRAQKGKSTFELPTGQLAFGGAASMQLDGQVTSKNLDIRDFFNVFHLDEDPRFTQIEGTLETNARIHLALGGPEDLCKGGYLDVQASVNAHKLNLLGEKFDEAHAELGYRWLDQQAGLDGAEIDVRSLALTKVKKEGRAPLGTVLGSIVVHRGGELRGSMVLQGFPLGRADMLGSIAPSLEGSASGVARLGGTLEAYTVEADIDVTPMRIAGAAFGGSDLHIAINQLASKPRVVGKTACGASISAPFDKEAWVRDTSVQGNYTLDGALFGGQVKVEKLVVTRQKSPVASGHIQLAGFDLGPIGKLLVPESGGDADPNGGAAAPPLGGEISGDIVIDRVATDDIAHAKGRFTPSAIRVARGGQTLSLRTSPTSAPGVAIGPPIVIVLSDDTVQLPPVTFDLAAPNGFKGAFAVKGAINKVTRGAELALDAELSPIDLGILVGIVPRMTRAIGTLSGSVKLRGKATEPQFDGQLKVRTGEFAFKGLPGGITDVEIDLVADENEARVTRAAGHFLGGDVSMTGRMPLKGGKLGIAEAAITGRQLYVSPLEGVKATVDADLQLTVNPTATSTAARLPFVGGEVTITSFEYTRPITIDLTGFRGSKRTVVESYDPTLDAVTLGFDVRSRVPLRIRNNLVDAQLAIDPRGLRVTGTNQRIGLRGELTTIVGGHVRVFANDFEVQKGSIRFDDPTRIAPHVDITALTEYRRYSNTLATAGSGANTTGGAGATSGGVTSGGQGGSLWRITLHAYGDADDLKVDMTSDPALSREDIFFLLTIGLTRAEVDQVRAGSVYAGAAFEAIGTVSGVDRAVKQAIPVIDDFRPGTAYSPRSGRVEPTITVGRRLGENVRARLTSGLAEDPQLRSAIEWRLGRTLTVEPSYDRIDTVSSTNVGNFGLDFRWRLEFD
jgi:translocation and assembly module TamB